MSVRPVGICVLGALVAVLGCGKSDPPKPAPPPTPAPVPQGVSPAPAQPQPTGAESFNPAPDFPLDPVPEYQDLPAEFVKAVERANGQVTYSTREPNGVWYPRNLGDAPPRPKTGLPLVRFSYLDNSKQPDLTKLPVCPVPFGVLVEEYKTHLADALKPLAAQPNLEMLHTRGPVTAAAFEPLAARPGLKRLLLWETADDDSSAGVVKLFPKLVDLDLRGGAKVGPKTLDAAAATTGLQHLSLFGCVALTDADVARLLPLKDLRTFSRELYASDMLNSKLTAAVADTLAKFDKLERIDLRGYPVLGRKIAALTRLTRLRHLAVQGTDPIAPVAHNDADMKALARLPHLADLDLGQVGGVTPEGWKALGATPELKHLHVREKVAGIAAFAGLEELTIQDWFKVFPEDVAALAAMPNLKRLTLQGQSGFGHKELGVFLDAGRLEALALYTGNVSGTSFENIDRLKGLRRLVVRPPQKEFTDTLINHLLKVPTLEELTLPQTEGFTAAGFRKLAGLKQLKVLHLYPGFTNSADKEAAIADLKKALPGCAVLGGKR